MTNSNLCIFRTENLTSSQIIMKGHNDYKYYSNCILLFVSINIKIDARVCIKEY